MNTKKRDYSKRGVLATINSVYDLPGLVSPVVLQGRLLQRKLLPTKKELMELNKLGWDDPLPIEMQAEWDAWCESLRELLNVSITRRLAPKH